MMGDGYYGGPHQPPRQQPPQQQQQEEGGGGVGFWSKLTSKIFAGGDDGCVPHVEV